jgi:hypothetical protein
LIQRTQQFTVADPRTFDGDPYEVAERAVRQAAAVAAILKQAIDSAYLMARNAQMERDLVASGECDAYAYDESAEGRRFATIKAEVENVESRLKPLTRAVGYNPKQPLTA